MAPGSDPIYDADHHQFVFDASPVALWLEDFTGVADLLAELRGNGITDVNSLLLSDESLLKKAIGLIEVTAVNRAAMALVGAANSSDLLGPLPADLITGDAARGLVTQIAAVWDGLDRVTVELEGTTFGGDFIDCILHWSAPTVNGATDLSRVVVAITDITDRKEGEFRSITAVSTDAIISADGHGIVRSWNPAAETMFGYSNEAAIGMDLRTIMPERYRGAHGDGLKRAREGSQPGVVESVELTGTRKDGTEFPIELTIGSWESRDGPLHGAIIRDITGRKEKESEFVALYEALQSSHAELANAHEELGKTQTQLLQAQRLESIGELAAGIAHEINTPIQYVGDNVRFMRDSFAEMQSFHQSVELLKQAAATAGLDGAVAAFEAARQKTDLEFLATEIPAAAEQTLGGVARVAEIVRALKDFAHPGSDELVMVDLGSSISSTLSVSRNEWKYVADVETDFDPVLTDVPALSGPLNQAILNIVVNAAHAIAQKTGEQPDDASKGLISIETKAVGEWAQVRISDTGNGIPEAVQGRIFDPFFTTKDVGKGSGQGLAIAHNVVCDRHGGTLTFETEPGAGTTFIIRIPRQANEAAA